MLIMMMVSSWWHDDDVMMMVLLLVVVVVLLRSLLLLLLLCCCCCCWWWWWWWRRRRWWRWWRWSWSWWLWETWWSWWWRQRRYCNNATIISRSFICLHRLLLDTATSHVDLAQLKFNTFRPRQNGRLFADDTFKRIFLNENVRISIKISLKFVPKGPINNNPALVQIMAWRRSGDKPLSEPMMVGLLTHICVTRPQWVKIRSRCPLSTSTLFYFDRTGFGWSHVWLYAWDRELLLSDPKSQLTPDFILDNIYIYISISTISQHR